MTIMEIPMKSLNICIVLVLATAASLAGYRRG